MGTFRNSVGIVGAGLAGLTCARELIRMGFNVNLFDKGRVPGGRIATRLTGPGLTFDHGAQYFTARDPRFRGCTADWITRGVVAEWNGRVIRLEGGMVIDTSPETRYVGVPGMSALATDLADGLSVRSGTRVTSVLRERDSWTIATDGGETVGPFDTLVVTLPAPQSLELFRSHPLMVAASTVQMTPCWAVMVAFESRLEVPWDGAFVHGSPLRWVARNSSKPGRVGDVDCWVLHASPDWSVTQLETTSDIVANELLGAFSDAVSERLPPHIHIAAHRWRYSQGSDEADRRILSDSEESLVFCGDWLASGRVEGAFLAGIGAAEAIGNWNGLR